MSQLEHNCIIAVDERGDAFLIKSEPSLYEHDIFDGNSLEDNINTNVKDIPTECGIYKCKIMVQHHSYMTDIGTEYDVNTWLEDVVKLDIV
jgi:hypothetical protein